MSNDRQIPKKYKVVWTLLAVMFVPALFTSGSLSWWFSVVCLGHFAAWEASGVMSARIGDTLSESVWAILQVKDNSPVNRALFPLIMGAFAGAACLFVGIVYGAAAQHMSDWARLAAAIAIACGTLGFLVRHFRRGDSL